MPTPPATVNAPSPEPVLAVVADMLTTPPEEIEIASVSDAEPMVPASLMIMSSLNVTIPPDEIIRMTKGRRGQHTPDPMTCIGLGKVTTKKFAEFKIQNITDLKTKILEAYLQGQNHADLRDYARTHREENEKRLLEVQAKLESII